MDVPLWSIKYRPKKWEDLVGQDRAVSMLRGLVQSGTCPNLLLFGPSGTGKSSAALILANEFLGELVDTNLLYLNVRDLMTYPISKAKRTLSDLAKLSREERSSMDEYMSMVYREASEMLRARGESGTPNKSQLLHAAIFIFASTMTVSQERVKLMILDEADALDDNMQQALRRTMEIYSNACRFVMIAQSVSGWNPAVISRCAVVRFPALDQEVIRRHLAQIAQAESVEVEPHAMSAICRVANGDLRRAIDILQLATCATGRATEDDVYEVSDSYLTREVREMVTHAIRGAFGKSRDSMRKLLAIEGYSPQDVLREILYDLVRRPFSPEHLRELIDRTANIDYRMSQGRNPFIHIEALLATIQRVAAQ